MKKHFHSHVQDPQQSLSFSESKIISPANRLTIRRHIVATLHQSLNHGDFKQASFLNALLSQEAFQRAYRTLKAWEKTRDPATGLVSTYLLPEKKFWIPKDTAADLSCYLWMASRYLDKPHEKIWLDALAKEREICGLLPCSIQFQPTKKMDSDLPTLIFGAAEYVKDGLLPLIERFGQGPWLTRAEEIMQELMDQAYIETPFGKISSSNVEVNGVILQALTRLYWITQKKAYLEMAERIGELYLFQVFPQYHFIPPMDFKSDSNASNLYFRLRDHGNEIIPGLSELYLLEKIQKRPQANRYREPLKKFLDTILVTARSENGLWYNTIDLKTNQSSRDGVIDTWGYILNAYHTFDLTEGTSIYSDEVRRTMQAAAKLKSYVWEEGIRHDGYADTIESMLYLLPWFNIPECHFWVDDEIEVMFLMEKTSGFVGDQYLDGNFIRTALLYALYKTQGLTLEPWHEDSYLGAAYDPSEKELYIQLHSVSPWKGILRFDLPRHQTILNLPFNYPRLNTSPEWFTADIQKNYTVVNLKTGEETSYSGKELGKGLQISLNENDTPIVLKVSEK
jgi:hypothetical protein